MKKFLGLILAFSIAWLANATPAAAQGMIAAVKSACAIQTYTVGRNNNVTMDPGGGLCLSGGGSGGTTTSQNQVFVGAAWQNWAGVLEGGVNVGLIDWSTSSQAHADMTSSIPAGSALIGGTNLYDNGALNSLTNPAFIAQAEAADITGTFTNGTQTGNVTNTNADGYPTGLISIHGTYGTASATFLISDDGGTTTYPVACTRSDGSATEIGYTALTNVSRQWTCPVGGNDTLEVLSSAVASGTVNVRVGISAGAQPGVPVAYATPTARNFPGCTVGATTGQCLAASTATQFLQIQNTSASATVACAFGVSAVLNSASSVQLGAGQSASWGPNTAGVPSGALNCIASGASTPLYLEWK